MNIYQVVFFIIGFTIVGLLYLFYRALKNKPDDWWDDFGPKPL